MDPLRRYISECLQDILESVTLDEFSTVAAATPAGSAGFQPVPPLGLGVEKPPSKRRARRRKKGLTIG